MRQLFLLVVSGLASLAAGGWVVVVERVEFIPDAGFAGDSEGNGSLRLLNGRPSSFDVRSGGSEPSDGTFRLEQTVTLEGKPSKHRVWMISTASPNRRSATLSDAAGAVTRTTSGCHLFRR